MSIFKDAIEMHVLWKAALKTHIEEGILQDIRKVGDCHACDLGHWIYGEGIRYNHLPSFETMCTAHEQFHRTAAEVVYLSNADNKMGAILLLAADGDFSRSSNKLIKALMDCSKDLADSLATGISSRHKVKDILKNKENHNVYSIDGQATPLDAIKIMVDHNIGSIAVNQDNKFLGIFTERGYMQHILFRGECCLEGPVSEMMDMNTIFVDLNDSIEECMTLMTTTHTRHLPVVDQGRLAGMISIGDVVKQLVSDDGDNISQLEGYIHGSYGAQ